jgi:hypothetical protein
MKNIYPVVKPIVISDVITSDCNITFSQCHLDSLNKLSCDTTPFTGRGSYPTDFKFPKFSADSGLLGCIKMCITITGRVTMTFENN